MADQTIRMNIDETLEFDYLVERISRESIKIMSEPNDTSSSINHIKKEFGVFDPPNTGIYKLNVNNQVIKIEVVDIFDSAVSRYKFDNNSDTTTAVDSKGDNNAIINGATYTTNSYQGDNALYFDGDNDYVRSPFVSTVTSSFSWSLWANIANVNDIGLLIDNRDSNYEGVFLEIKNGDIRFIVDGGGEITTSINPNVWTLLVCVYDYENSELRLYMDGVRVNSTQNNTVPNTDTVTIFGNQSGGSSGFDGQNPIKGKLDDITFFDYPLTDQDVSDLYSSY
jgi:hypothetical protein